LLAISNEGIVYYLDIKLNYLIFKNKSNFLRALLLYILLSCIFFSSCEQKPEKVKRKLQLTKVFEIPAPVDSAELKRKFFLENNKDTSYLEFVFKAYDLVDIYTIDSTIKVDLRYADTNNFLGINLYDGLRKAYLTCETANKVAAAQFFLKQIDPNLSLIILDASRPQHIQQIMWDSLKMVPSKKFHYLSPPNETSLHNYGCAVDVSIVNLKTGQLLDMGTEFDTFEKLSQPILELHFLKTGELSKEVFENRRILRYVMKRAKMNPINSEWWHFSSMSREEVVRQHPLIK